MGYIASGYADTLPCHRTNAATDRPLGSVILEAVSEESDTDVLDLPPLEESIDTDALESLLTDCETDWTLGFHYDGYEVVVQSNRSIALYERE